MFFDIGPLKLVALVIIAVVIFGPDKLPKLVSDATRFLRTIREFSDNAKQEIRKELGPEFDGFEFEDLNPKTFVRKQLNTHADALDLGELRDLKDNVSTGATALSARSREVLADPLAHVEADRVHQATPSAAPTAHDVVSVAHDVDPDAT